MGLGPSERSCRILRVTLCVETAKLPKRCLGRNRI